jgi:hypothetical protein
MKNKKGDLSINIIIVAAIALIVLVVMVAVFTGRISIWGKNVDELSNKSCDPDLKGQWKAFCDSSNKEQPVYGRFTDTNAHPGQVCCVIKN